MGIRETVGEPQGTAEVGPLTPSFYTFSSFAFLSQIWITRRSTLPGKPLVVTDDDDHTTRLCSEKAIASDIVDLASI